MKLYSILLIAFVSTSCSTQDPIDKIISNWCTQQNDGFFLKINYKHFDQDQEKLFKSSNDWPDHWGTLHITFDASTKDDSIRFSKITQDSLLVFAQRTRSDLTKLFIESNPPSKYLSFRTDVARYYPGLKHKTILVVYKNGTYKFI